jgi:tRNA dimethylallyltransferase
MTGEDRPVLAIVGPTASGKTALSIRVAEVLQGEVISMDSRQIFRGMDIGTAKATREERARVPHHGLDIVDPREHYSAARFAEDARRWIEGIRGRDRWPLLVGGTGFFLKALTDPVFEEPPIDRKRRARLRTWFEGRSKAELAPWVERLDPERAEVALAGGIHRIARTLEVALLTGRPLSWWHRNAPPVAPPLRPLIFRLALPREELYGRINRRARAMFDSGLVAEVAELLEAGVPRDAPSMTGTGYREAAEVLEGSLSVEEAIDRVQRVTRRYARRQETWFRHQLPEEGVEVIDASLLLEDQLRQVLLRLKRWSAGGTGGARDGVGGQKSNPPPGEST